MNNKELKYGKEIEDKVFFVKQLDALGLYKGFMGYYSLIELMEILINQDVRVKSFSREVYPIIANKYGKTPCTIERNIRSLIDKCWSMELMQKLNVYYADNKKPTCREFIYLIKNYILKQII